MSEVNIENKNEQTPNPVVEEDVWVSRVTAPEAPAEEPKVEEVTTPEEPKDEIITTPHAVSNSEPVESSMGNDLPSGAFSTNVKKAAKKAAPKADKVAVDKTQIVVFSEKNIYFPNTGKLTYGFNIVTEKQAEVYLKHKSVREATPQELAEKYKK